VDCLLGRCGLEVRGVMVCIRDSMYTVRGANWEIYILCMYKERARKKIFSGYTG